MRINTLFRLKLYLLSSVLLFLVSSTSGQSFTATSVSVITSNPDSCTSIQVDVLTYLGCINFTMGPSSYTVNGSTIDIQVHYTSSPICAGAISNPLFNVNLQNVSPGSYTLNATAYLDNVSVNTVTNSLSVASCLSTSLTSYEEADKFHLFPNPAKNEVTIQLKDHPITNWEYTIEDLKGRAISKGKLIPSNTSFSIPLENLSEGIYLLKLNNNQRVYSKKLIISK